MDYAFHLIISDPTEQVTGQELPALIKDGYTSFKIYTTYDLLKLDDRQILDVLSVARRERALVMVHAENHDVISWLSERLLAAGHSAPRFHAVAHAPIAEREATLARDLARRARRRADPHRSRVVARGDGANPLGAGPRPQGLWRDLPAIPVPDRRTISIGRALRAQNTCAALRRATRRTRR